jgi:hypothetical protein
LGENGFRTQTAIVDGGQSFAGVWRLRVAVVAERSTVERWLVGSTEPRLPELLCWVQATTQRLRDFVAIVVDPATLSSTRSTYRLLLAQRELAYQLPLTHAVLRGLELDPEKNRAVKRYWANQGLCRLERAKEGRSLFSYYLFGVTQESFEQIPREHIESFERVRTIVAASRGAERVVLLNQQLIALEE